jgi:hypothetical protein
MRASTWTNGRGLWLGLAAATLALTVWGTTLFANLHTANSLSQKPNLELQTADPGGGGHVG